MQAHAPRLTQLQPDDFWSAIPQAISRLTAIARAIRNSAFVTYMIDGVSPILSFASRVGYNSVVSFYRGFTLIKNLYGFLSDENKSKKTWALLDRTLSKTLKYAAVPFFYYSAIQPKLNDSEWLSTINYSFYAGMGYIFVRRLIDYAIQSSLIPKAIEDDLHFEPILIFLRELLSNIAVIYARYLGRDHEKFRALFYNEIHKVLIKQDLRKWYTREVRDIFQEEIFKALLVVFVNSNSLIAPMIAEKLAAQLTAVIFDALDIVLNKKPIDTSLYMMLEEKHGASFSIVFNGLVSGDGHNKLAKGAIDQIAKAGENLKIAIPHEPYAPSHMTLQQKIRSETQSSFYAFFNTITVEGLAFIFNFFIPFFASEKIALYLVFVIRALLYGQILLEYQLAANGVSAEDRYSLFAKRNFACLGLGASQSVSLLSITEGLKYFYGISSFFLTGATSHLVLQFHLASLFLNKKAFPEELVSFDSSKKIRILSDKSLDNALVKMKPKMSRLDDVAGRQRCIDRLKKILTSRTLIWIVASSLTEMNYSCKYFLSSSTDMQKIDLLKVVVQIPAIKLLLQEYAPDLIGIVEQVHYAHNVYLKSVSYAVWLSSTLLSSPVVGENSVVIKLFMSAATYATVSRVVSTAAFTTQLMEQKGFINLLLQFEAQLKGILQKPESVMTAPLLTRPVDLSSEEKRSSVTKPDQISQEELDAAVAADITNALVDMNLSRVNIPKKSVSAIGLLSNKNKVVINSNYIQPPIVQQQTEKEWVDLGDELKEEKAKEDITQEEKKVVLPTHSVLRSETKEEFTSWVRGTVVPPQKKEKSMKRKMISVVHYFTGGSSSPSSSVAPKPSRT